MTKSAQHVPEPDPLTERDVAMLYDGLPRHPPEDLAQRLREMVRAGARFLDRVRALETIARAAGLPDDRKRRLTSAWDLQEDLVYLLDAKDWEHPFDVLDPSAGQGTDLQALLTLAGSRADEPDPPAGLAAVRDKLARAIAEEDALVSGFVQDLLGGSSRRAEYLLRRAEREVRRRLRSRTPPVGG